jgi:hypothetical protein
MQQEWAKLVKNTNHTAWLSQARGWHGPCEPRPPRCAVPSPACPPVPVQPHDHRHKVDPEDGLKRQAGHHEHHRQEEDGHAARFSAPPLVHRDPAQAPENTCWDQDQVDDLLHNVSTLKNGGVGHWAALPSLWIGAASSARTRTRAAEEETAELRVVQLTTSHPDCETKHNNSPIMYIIQRWADSNLLAPSQWA